MSGAATVAVSGWVGSVAAVAVSDVNWSAGGGGRVVSTSAGSGCGVSGIMVSLSARAEAGARLERADAGGCGDPDQAGGREEQTGEPEHGAVRQPGLGAAGADGGLG